jgi:NAD(P)-dependent dehydrogenase (short-subunit alcohol dehydrogenase family)
MKALEDKTIVVVGGTGNVGSFIVRELLEQGARVVVPSRSGDKIQSLLSHIEKLNKSLIKQLYLFKGNLSNEEETPHILDHITNDAGKPDAAISSLGYFIPAPSLLSVDFEDLNRVMDGYLNAHFKVARTFLPFFKENGGMFVFINGPLAFEPWEGSGLVSIATSAQHLLFKSLAKELEGTKAQVVELVNYAYIRNRQTQPSSAITGKEVGAYCAWLVSGKSGDQHGKSIHLRSPEQVKEIGNNKTIEA